MNMESTFNRILILVPGRWHAFDLARELVATGQNVRVVTNYPKFKTRQWGLKDENVRSFFWHHLLVRAIWACGGEGLDIRTTHFTYRAFSRAAARKVRPGDMVHAWAGAAYDTLKRPDRASFRLILDRGSAHRLEQDQILQDEYEKNGLLWPQRNQRVIRQEVTEYQRADRITVPSFFVERTFCKHGVPSKKLHRNPYGVDLGLFTPGPVRAGKPFRALYAGTLSLRKGTHYLIKAVREPQGSDFEVVLIGGKSGEIQPWLRDLPAHIRVLGHIPQSQLPEEYRQASVFVMASVEEGQAMVQLQALACGLPLICTSHTGGEDLLELSGPPQACPGGISEFPAGYVVPAGNPEALAYCLADLRYNPEKLEQKKEAARKLTREADFSWKRYALENLRLYEETSLKGSSFQKTA